MNICLQRVALRHNAIYAPSGSYGIDTPTELHSYTLYALGELRKSGFTLTEKALRVLDAMTAEDQGKLLEEISSIYGTKLNWTPLVRDWQTPTGQTFGDMLYTFIYNVVDCTKEAELPGTRLSCGHLIPDGVFDLRRYTGCPFCGRPFETSDTVNYGQGSRLRMLDVMDDDAMRLLVRNLLEMRTPLDATQLNSLTLLLDYYPMPEGVEIKMKETLLEVMSHFISADEPEKLYGLVNSPNDVLRYLWYIHTGSTKIVRPRTLMKQNPRVFSFNCPDMPCSARCKDERKQGLRLHFSRSLGKIVAWLLNTMSMPAEQMCAVMHPYREMWVHMIRALHLPQYARRAEMANCATCSIASTARTTPWCRGLSTKPDFASTSPPRCDCCACARSVRSSALCQYAMVRRRACA